MPGFEYLEHTADLKFRATGDDFIEALFNSGKALVHAITGEVEGEVEESKEFTISYAGDERRLVHDFLSEILYLTQYEGFTPLTYQGVLKDDSFDVKLQGITGCIVVVEVKAITFHELVVGKKKDEWIIQALADT